MLVIKFCVMGIIVGDCVVVVMCNLFEWLVVFFVVVLIGVIVVLLNVWWIGVELEYRFVDLCVCVLIVDDEWYYWFELVYVGLLVLEYVFVVCVVVLLGGVVSWLEDVIGILYDWCLLFVDVMLLEVMIVFDDVVMIFYISGIMGVLKGVFGSYCNMMLNILIGGYFLVWLYLWCGEMLFELILCVMLMVILMFYVIVCLVGMMGVIVIGSMVIFMYKWDMICVMEIIECEKVYVMGGVLMIVW